MAGNGSGYHRDFFALLWFCRLSVFHAADVGVVDLHSLRCVLGSPDFLLIHKAAKKAFDDLALKKLPTVKSLQAEYSDLLVQKKLDYAALAKARDEAKRLQIHKANAEMLLRTDAEEQRQTRERQQEK